MTENSQEIDQFGKILQESARIAQQFGATSYTTYHALLAIMRMDVPIRSWLEGKGVSFNLLLEHASDLNDHEPFIGQIVGRAIQMAKTANVSRQAVHLLYSIISFGEGGLAIRALSEQIDTSGLQRELLQLGWHKEEPAEEEDSTVLLDGTLVDMTARALTGRYRLVTGRDDEVRRLVEILAQKDTLMGDDEAINNPLLVGEAGIGKSAVVKALALLIAQRDEAVRFLWGHRVLSMLPSELQSGTGVRGSLEEKFKAVLQECQGDVPTILFIDELHTIMGLGQTDGSSGLEQTLKPVLAEGLSCIGATTTAEWRMHVENQDVPFARRWIQVPMDEPNAEGTLAILLGASDTLARRHLVYFSGGLLAECVSLARQHMPYDASPAREIDKILNGVGSRAKLDTRTSATLEDLYAVISQITGYPVVGSSDEQQGIVNLQETLQEEVIGQPEACRVLSQGVMRYEAGLSDPEKPLVVLLLGPTGVGKTHMSRTIAQIARGGRLVRFDMSEYQEKHTISKLIGAPPGYVGYEQEGQLTEAMRRIGMGVVLLDEIEKAHSDIHQTMLGLFDSGRLTDGHGRTVYASNCIIVLTSNIGSDRFGTSTTRGIGFTAGESHVRSHDEVSRLVLSDAKQIFSSELWNRIDAKVVCNPLSQDDVRSITEKIMREQQEQILHNRVPFTLTWSDDVVAYLAEVGFSPTLGARPIKRAIAEEIQTLLARPLLEGQIVEGTTVQLSMQDGSVIWSAE